MTKKKIKLSTVLVIFVSIIILALMLILSVKNRKKAAYTVAFYKVPAPLEEQMEGLIKRNYVGSVSYINIDSDSVPAKSQLKNIDILFTWNGAVCQTMARNAITLDEEILSPLNPQIKKSAFVDGKLKYLPVLLDSFNLQTLNSNGIIYNMPIPYNWNEFTNYLEMMKENVEEPLFVNFSNDSTLIDFTGAIVESICGGQAYLNLIELLQKDTDLTSVSTEPLGQNSQGETITLNDIIGIIKEMISSGYITENSFNKTAEEEELLLKKRKAYGNIMMLSTFTELDAAVVNRFSTINFPQDEEIIDHALIAPELVMLTFSKRKVNTSIAKYMLSDGVQNLLSQVTYLAPVTPTALPYDQAADNIRYMAGASPMGPIPNLSLAAFTDSLTVNKFASQLRDELH